MRNNKVYDCIIIGGGISGLMAGKELEKNKVNYLILDKKKEIGKPLKCGEGVCKETFDRYFPKDNYPFIENTISKIRFIIFGDRTKKERAVRKSYYQFNRTKFEKWLSKGLNIKLKNEVIDVERNEDGFSVKLKNSLIRTKTIILSYGCSYTIQKKFGLISKVPEIAKFYLGIFNNCKVPEDEFLFSYYKKNLVGFWAFPKGNGMVNAGVGSFQSERVNLKDEFSDFCKKLKGFEKIKAELITGAIEPISGPIKKTFDNGMVVTGDAAGFTYGLSGEGIKYAIISGDIAGKIMFQAIKTNDFSSKFLSVYEKKCKKEFYNELKAGIMLKEIAKYIYKRHPNLVVKMFMAPKEKDLLRLANGDIPLKVKILHKYIKWRM